MTQTEGASTVTEYVWHDASRPNTWADEQLYTEQWVKAEAASGRQLSARLYRAAKGGGTVLNDDHEFQARQFADKQNAMIAAMQRTATPIERARIWARHIYRDPLPTALLYLRHKEGIDVSQLPADLAQVLRTEVKEMFDTAQTVDG